MKMNDYGAESTMAPPESYMKDEHLKLELNLYCQDCTLSQTHMWSKSRRPTECAGTWDQIPYHEAVDEVDGIGNLIERLIKLPLQIWAKFGWN